MVTSILAEGVSQEKLGFTAAPCCEYYKISVERNTCSILM